MKKEQVVEVTVDDFDHESPAQTHTFEFQGQHYEIDLAEWNLGELQQAQELLSDALDKLRQFAEAGRPVAGEVEAEATSEAINKRAGNGKAVTVHNRDVRGWAQEQGLEVGRTGLLPKNIQEEYLKAHPDHKIAKSPRRRK